MCADGADETIIVESSQRCNVGIEREQGLPAAQLALAQIQQLPIHHLDATLSRILAAAHIKAHHAISYADAFAVAAAQEQQATLLTGDPEFGKAAASIAVEWLARNY